MDLVNGSMQDLVLTSKSQGTGVRGEGSLSPSDATCWQWQHTGQNSQKTSYSSQRLSPALVTDPWIFVRCVDLHHVL